jgi:hypothetical protein
MFFEVECGMEKDVHFITAETIIDSTAANQSRFYVDLSAAYSN